MLARAWKWYMKQDKVLFWLGLVMVILIIAGVALLFWLVAGLFDPARGYRAASDIFEQCMASELFTRLECLIMTYESVW